jgi:hypothetical protein
MGSRLLRRMVAGRVSFGWLVMRTRRGLWSGDRRDRGGRRCDLGLMVGAAARQENDREDCSDGEAARANNNAERRAPTGPDRLGSGQIKCRCFSCRGRPSFCSRCRCQCRSCDRSRGPLRGGRLVVDRGGGLLHVRRGLHGGRGLHLRRGLHGGRGLHLRRGLHGGRGRRRIDRLDTDRLDTDRLDRG